VSQLGLPMATRRHDALCRVLPISPPVEGQDGSLESTWLLKVHRTDRVAWSVEPVPEGCRAWEIGYRWFYRAHVLGPCFSTASGGRAGTRDEVALYAQLLLLRSYLSNERYRLVGRWMELRLAERNALACGYCIGPSCRPCQEPG
jgi:hypothetical protein